MVSQPIVWLTHDLFQIKLAPLVNICPGPEMFNSLDEVKSRWDKLFSQHQNSRFDFPSPGYPEAEIAVLEK
jgi:hypothetical protein